MPEVLGTERLLATQALAYQLRGGGPSNGVMTGTWAAVKGEVSRVERARSRTGRKGA